MRAVRLSVRRFWLGLVPGVGLAWAALWGARMLPLQAQPPWLAAGHRPVAPPKDPAATALEARLTHQVMPLLATYCYECHGHGAHDGNLRLDAYPSLAAIQADRQTWRAVQNLVQLGLMPQDKERTPTTAEVQVLARFAEDAVRYVDTSGPRDPGRVMLHRLNRDEYNNTMRDLLGIDLRKNPPAADFPADDSGYGFDNIADVLAISPLLAEKYLAAAEVLIDRAVPPEVSRERKAVNLPLDQMATSTGSMEENFWNLYTAGEVYADRPFGLTADYEIRVRAAQDQGGSEPARMTLKLDGRDLQTFAVTPRRGKPETYAVRTRIAAGTHRIAAAFINDYYDPKAPDPKLRDRNLLIYRVDIDGPMNVPPEAAAPSASQQAIFIVMPGQGVAETQAARTILQRFATRAYRRPATDQETQRLVALFAQTRGTGESFTASVKVALTAVLVAPQFLFRLEIDPPPDAAQAHGPVIRPLNDYELATRLAYFLWSSMPDDALFRAAAAGQLHDAATLEAQVRRMLADAKANALIRNFVGQWLELRNLENVSPSPKRFPEFNAELKDAMRREAEMFVGSILREDRGLTELLAANYTFVNERLARLYGIPGVRGAEMRRVELPAASPRGGVLTMAGVLTVTSMPARTSPVKRGKWILEELLADAPPPPPPGVPVLPAKPAPDSPLSFRQMVERHRTDVTCAGCHARMDPLGFAMDHFDAIGAWRDRDGTHAIDSSGQLPDGQSVDGAEGLKRLLLARQSDFVRCLTQKMLTYALGRGLEEYDRPTVADICRDVEKNQFKASSLIMGIVRSDAFGKRRIGPPLEPPGLRMAGGVRGGAAGATVPMQEDKR